MVKITLMMKGWRGTGGGAAEEKEEKEEKGLALNHYQPPPWVLNAPTFSSVP